MLPSRRNKSPQIEDSHRRKHSARDVLVTTLKHLTTMSEVKYLHAQFGSIHACYVEKVELMMITVIH